MKIFYDPIINNT